MQKEILLETLNKHSDTLKKLIQTIEIAETKEELLNNIKTAGKKIIENG